MNRPERIHVYLTRELARRLKAALALEGKSVSEWVRDIAARKVAHSERRKK